MAWIEMIKESAADEPLAEIYRKLRRSGSKAGEDESVDNVLKIHSLNPPSMLDHYRLYKTLMFGNSKLSRQQREMIAVAVSVANECKY